MRPTRVRATPRPGGARAAESALPEVLAMHRRAKRTLALRAPWRTTLANKGVGSMADPSTPVGGAVRWQYYWFIWQSRGISFCDFIVVGIHLYGWFAHFVILSTI